MTAKKPNRFENYVKIHKQHFGAPPSGPLLDYGAGAGQFLIDAHNGNMACFGVETCATREKEFHRRIAELANDRLAEFFRLYEGDILPYNAKYFGGVYSWFVLEHVSDLWSSLREIVRVTKPGGTIFLLTQDARNCYDGHCDKPWPPFLPPRFIKAYLEEFGYEPDYIKYILEEVYYVTSPMVSSVLKALGCEIVYQSSDPEPAYLDSLDVSTEDEARAYARKIKDIVEKGEWSRPTENATIFARRK